MLLLEAGLLFVAANTGFLGGPAVLSNMAADSWVPYKFRYLSTRLVTENGILLMGLAAPGILIWTGGSVTLLVVLYSISVFLTFAVSLFGLCRFWVKRRGEPRWLARLALSTIGFAVCAGVFAVLLVKKFGEFDELRVQLEKEFPNTIFFTSRLLFANENWFIRLLPNQSGHGAAAPLASFRQADHGAADEGLERRHTSALNQ